MICQIMYMNSICPKAKKEVYLLRISSKRCKDLNNLKKYQVITVSKELLKKFKIIPITHILLSPFILVPISIYGKYCFLDPKKLLMRMGFSYCMLSSLEIIPSNLLKLDLLLLSIIVTWILREEFAIQSLTEITVQLLPSDRSLIVFMDLSSPLNPKILSIMWSQVTIWVSIKLTTKKL